MNFFFEIHKDIPREGPGENRFTRMAFNMLSDLTNDSKLIDIGCGPGEQTIELAKCFEGSIYALDNHQPFLDRLHNKVMEQKLENKVDIINGTMFDLGSYIEDNSVDVIWSEGSVNIFGFEKALYEWKKYIREKGYMVVSDLSWIKSNAPKEVVEFWEKDYPEMKRVDQNILSIEEAGYRVVGTLTLPDKAWMENYYGPLENRIEKLREEHSSEKLKIDQLNEAQFEIDIFKKYSEYYGYVFYIMQKK